MTKVPPPSLLNTVGVGGSKMFFHCHQAVIMLSTQELLIMLAIQEFSTGVKWALKDPEAPLLDL